ncbi:helix-turn-helix transcriptional regulator [Chryseobacterium jejuense]|uniref:helix-turn-helix transcriptional regulator n=1 Tax=Chryseobacterium jejuense TaxID=445960 RepID=UPI001AEB67D7|nr:hypothetical protein [Chryseobacterium jejuense]MBP2615212.1 DNA-binding CsgD family transcriptional regulator [Chryseobacterium jejuense]
MSSKQNKTNYREKNKIYYIAIGGVAAAVSLMYYLLFSSNDRNTEKADLLIDKNKHKIFDEIIQLAKNNSPEFWAHFQEQYPDFRKKILVLNANLKVSELIFCAYIFLGFTTKDIAKYTFKAVQTIKNNKSNLRKRLNIPVQHDTTLWLRKKLEE